MNRTSKGTEYKVDSKNEIGMGIAYIIVVTFFNTIWIWSTYTRCKSVQHGFGDASLYALIPNILILGVIVMLMILVPWLKMPFANTIGYSLLKLFGVCTQFTNKNIFEGEKSASWGNFGILRSMMREDPILLFNQLTPENFSRLTGAGGNTANREWQFLKREGGDVGDPIIPDWDKNQWKAVNISYSISEFVWLLLAGILTLVTEQNALVVGGCTIGDKRDVLKASFNQMDKLRENE
tara:strand:+ start:284 stop:994 length:711 start_codon:yes stop_codon:yes gene_type:complete